MLQLKFNLYFSLGLSPVTKGEDLPFETGEIVFLKLVLIFTENVTAEKLRERDQEAYGKIEARLIAVFCPASISNDSGWCQVQREKDSSVHVVELVGDGTDWIIEAVLTPEDKELTIPIEVGQVIRVPFRVFSVQTFRWGGQVVSIVPTGNEHGQIATSDVEIIE